MQAAAAGPAGLPPSRKSGRWLVLLGLVVAAAFLASMLSATEGHFVPQVADLYLVCQYAKGFAEGHPFRYNPGDAPSTGATSLLHTLLLAAAHAAGLRGEALVGFAVLGGAVLYVGAIVVAWRLGLLLAGAAEAGLGAAAVGLGGPVVWGFLYGSDIAVFMFLCLWLLERLLSGWKAGTLNRAVPPAALVALTRPEGLIIALSLPLAGRLHPERPAGRRLLLWLPAACGVAVLCLYRMLTGSWIGSSLADKSLLANYGFAQSVAIVTEYGADVLRGLLLGFYPSHAPVGFARGWAPQYFFPFGLLFVAAGAVAAPANLTTPLRLWLATVFCTWVALSFNVFLGVHFNRHLLWAFPTLIVLAAVGVSATCRLLARGRPVLQRHLFAASALVLLVLGLLATARFAVLYGEMAGEIYRRDVAAARWIGRNLPAGASIANLATSVEYLTGHRNVNLHGVTSPAFFGNRTAEREAGMIEALARLPGQERPPYLITTLSAQDAYPAMRELVDGPPLFRSTALGDEIEIYRTRYAVLDRGGRWYLPATSMAAAGRQLVDALNVCDAWDEAAHGYRYRSALGDLRLHGAVGIDGHGAMEGDAARVIDGGRAIIGSESFSIRATPGKDLLLVMRTAPQARAAVLRAGGGRVHTLEFGEAGFVLKVDGEQGGRLSFRPAPGWNEAIVAVPKELIRRARPRLELAGRYASFRYWFLQ